VADPQQRLTRGNAPDGLGFLGVSAEADPGGPADRQIGERAYVIAAREDLEIARQVRAVPGIAVRS
jgi:hypothetical protein